MKVLAIIPARSGSKRLKDKNMLGFEGLPLVFLAVQKASACCDKVIVSMDSHVDKYNLENFLDNYTNVEVRIRPPELATDDSTTESVVLYHINEIEKENQDVYDVIAIFQCTTPLIKKDDINFVLDIIKDFDFVVSVNEQYQPNGAMYVIKTDKLKKEGTLWIPSAKNALYKMPNERSVDIDYIWDFIIAQSISRGHVYER